MGIFGRAPEAPGHMELHKIYVFKDGKSSSYGPPFVEENKFRVIRSIQEQLPDKQAIWAKHPQDFSVFEIGEYDARSGEIKMYETKECVGLVQDFDISLGKSN